MRNKRQIDKGIIKLSASMKCPDDNVPTLWASCLAAELQRLSTHSIIPMLIDTFARCKRASEGEGGGDVNANGQERH